VVTDNKVVTPMNTQIFTDEPGFWEGTETSKARRSDDIFSENDEAVGGKLRGHGDKWYVR
jgi:hypothetical protein